MSDDTTTDKGNTSEIISSNKNPSPKTKESELSHLHWCELPPLPPFSAVDEKELTVQELGLSTYAPLLQASKNNTEQNAPSYNQAELQYSTRDFLGDALSLLDEIPTLPELPKLSQKSNDWLGRHFKFFSESEAYRSETGAQQIEAENLDHAIGGNLMLPHKREGFTLPLSQNLSASLGSAIFCSGKGACLIQLDGRIELLASAYLSECSFVSAIEFHGRLHLLRADGLLNSWSINTSDLNSPASASKQSQGNYCSLTEGIAPFTPRGLTSACQPRFAATTGSSLIIIDASSRLFIGDGTSFYEKDLGNCALYAICPISGLIWVNAANVNKIQNIEKETERLLPLGTIASSENSSFARRLLSRDTLTFIMNSDGLAYQLQTDGTIDEFPEAHFSIAWCLSTGELATSSVETTYLYLLKADGANFKLISIELSSNTSQELGTIGFQEVDESPRLYCLKNWLFIVGEKQYFRIPTKLASKDSLL